MESIGAVRLKKELTEIQENKFRLYEIKDAGKTDPNTWLVLLKPNRSPYNICDYQVQFRFPKEYPFKAPNIKFLTKIYHPNISEKGDVSLPIANPENWKPSVKVDHVLPPSTGINQNIPVLTALIDLFNSPQLSCVLRNDLAELYMKDPDAYAKNATEFGKHYSTN
ncbi:unnamed protein product [Thelazia callipaeda]|uniref:UBIQUITIN_CONJUGAT_2 domain-containing protein n=1 Tax=Thelazia callipaeda TaxID=103827 RepID=A0A0N5CUU6_THECL|nr:unnamed protein product [Thelazia callipaeda]